MNDAGGNFADETIEMASESGANQTVELRKRRSTRIVQAVPLVVTGVDALGRPFVERTSSLILNCHGCRYQSKHYVLKNMWVTLEIPHPESGQPPRAVRGRVAWIQRPRTVRQLFQVALELEVSGNAWGIAFPPEDWFAFPEGVQVPPVLDGPPQTQPVPAPALEPEAPAAVSEADLSSANTPANANDNLRVFPSPGSTTDTSLQLARQVARLVADARQQIQAAAQEAASHAASAERRLSFEQWEQKFAAGRAEIANETTRALEKLQQETDKQSREAHAAAAEALRIELPRWLAPQLEQLTRDLTDKLSQEAQALRGEHAQQLDAATRSLNASRQQAEETAARLKTQAEQAEAEIARVETTTGSLAATARQHEENINAQREALQAKAEEVQQQAASAQSLLQEQVSKKLETAHAQLRERLEGPLAEAQDRAAGGLNEHLRSLLAQLQEEAARHGAALQESTGAVGAEWEQRLTAMREAVEEQSQKLESILARAAETHQRIEQHSTEFQNAQEQTLAAFQAQLDETQSQRRNELHRDAESLVEQINARVKSTFEESANKAMEQFNQQIQGLVQPHITQTEEAIHRLAGGRSMVDAALTLQQDRIRASADEAFAESLSQFRENLGSVEQILRESSQSITRQSLAELDERVANLKHQVEEELLKSAEWYEKRAQTQIQNHSEKAVEQTLSQLREGAREISSVLATELDHSSRNFLGHTQTQMEDVVRDSFERARALYAEAADMTAAAFIDEIQRTARQELGGYNEELKRSTTKERTELAQKVNAEQEAFLKRFQESLGEVLQAGVAEAQKTVSEGFAPLLKQWKAMTYAHQQETKRVYDRIGEQVAEHHKTRLEGVSNQWLLATVVSLDHQSRELISGIATAAEEKLRAACSQVFEGVGDSLRQRLSEIAKNFTPPTEPIAPRAKGASSGN